MNPLKRETCQIDHTELIPLSRGLFATVSRIDYVWLSQWKWHASSPKSSSKIYAARADRSSGKYRLIFMHREILGLLSGDKLVADHIDGDGLNNRRSNLRKATHSQNLWNQGPHKVNTTGFKGVTYSHRKRRPWTAMISIKGKSKNLGTFTSKEEAFKAYCQAAKILHGEFVRTT